MWRNLKNNIGLTFFNAFQCLVVIWRHVSKFEIIGRNDSLRKLLRICAVIVVNHTQVQILYFVTGCPWKNEQYIEWKYKNHLRKKPDPKYLLEFFSKRIFY